LNRLRNLLGVISFALIVTACSSGGAAPPVVDELHEARMFSIESRPGNDLTNEEIEIVLNGSFDHSCSRISNVNQEINGRTITLEIETARTGKDGCETRVGSVAQFIHIVPIDTEVLRPGLYTVAVGNLTTEFEIE